jgi:hypothetical protein
MLLAFLVDQIQQHCCPLFRQLWKGLGTKSKLWGYLRSLFQTLLFESMAALFHHMASLYRLHINFVPFSCIFSLGNLLACLVFILHIENCCHIRNFCTILAAQLIFSALPNPENEVSFNGRD